MKICISMLCMLLVCSEANGAAKPHVITFGKWMTLKSHPEGDNPKMAELKTRTLFVDGRPK